MINKELHKVYCQACIDEYNGEHGKVKNILNNVTTFKVGHVEGRIGDYDDRKILVFRGSDGWTDWFDNIKAFWTKTPKEWFGKSYRLHAGFVSQVKTIYNRIMELTKEMNELIIIGHSLGAAVGTIFAGILTKRSIKVTLVTFGSPRVGLIGFVKWLNKKIYQSIRYVLNEDSVTKVPPVWMGYTHIKLKIILGKTSIIERILFPIVKIFGNPLDHYPQDYLKQL
jgi:predicted lipase